jgi:hypothetical protein
VVLAWFAAHVRVDVYVRAGAAQQGKSPEDRSAGSYRARLRRRPNDAVEPGNVPAA